MTKKSRNSRRPINDIRHNNTNITVQFKKVLPLNLIPGPGAASSSYIALRLAPGIAQITRELGAIYKLYRFTSVKFTFQAELTQDLDSALALNYIPAQESLSTLPSGFDQFEGPAVGFYANGRGTPYHYTTPSMVLNAMPYNWYETKSAELSDLTQGVYYFYSNVPEARTINVYAHFVCEFQTLEDPAFLAGQNSQKKKKGDVVVDIEDIDDLCSIYKGPSVEGHELRRRNFPPGHCL